MKKRLKYRSENEKFFLDYFPDRIFKKLNKSEREHYREYRRYHRAIFDTNERIESYQNQIEKLKKKIIDEKDKLVADDYKDGYTMLMKTHYNHISDFDKQFKFNVSGSWRDKSSRSYKEKVGIESFEKRDKTKIAFTQKTYKGEEIKKRESLYLHVSASDVLIKFLKKDESTPSNRKNIAFGSLDKCRLALSEIYDEDWSKDDKEVVKDEVKVIVRGYVRFFIFERGWSTFITSTHSRDKIIEWCKGLGKEMYEWC